MNLTHQPAHPPPPAKGGIALLVFVLCSLAVVIYVVSLGYIHSIATERIPGSSVIRLSYLPGDHGNDLRLEQVLELDDVGAFEQLHSSDELRLREAKGTGGTRWFRIGITNPDTSPRQVVLDLIWRFYDVVELYQQGSDGTWEAVYAGASVPGSEAKRSNRWAAFDLDLPPQGELTVFLKCQDRYRLPIKFLLWPNQTEFVLWEQFLFGTYFAYFCLWTGMLAYGAFLYALLRERAQWHFLLYAGSVGLFYFVSSGLGAVHFPVRLWSFSELLCAILASLAIYHLARFARYFLNTPQNDPPLDWWLQRLQWLLIGFLLVLPLGIWSLIGVFYLQAFILLALLVIVTLLWAGIRRLRAGSSEAIFILLALFPYLFSFCFWFFNAHDFFVRNDEQRLVGLIVNALTLIFLSFAAAYRHRQALIENSRLQVQYTRSLEKEVSDRTRVLQELSDQLTLALAERNRVMTIIGHDLRAPAASLLGLTRLLADDAKLFTPEKLAALANEIGNTCDLQLELLNNLLMWGSTQTGERKNVQRVDLSVKDELNSVWRLLNGMACTKRLTFYDAIPEDLRLHTDGQVLQTILRNLLVNAIKFTCPGGWIKVRAVPLRNGAVEISVQDNGVGISQEQLAMLFNGAVQSTPGTNVEKGTGIGLNLARDLARTLGGDIRIESVKGEGTTAFLTLP